MRGDMMDVGRCVNCMKAIDEGVACCPHCGYGQKEEQSPFGIRPGTILHGRYLTGRMLGQGGFGVTYVGYDLALDIRVAVKEYFPSGCVTRNNTVSNKVQWNTAQFNGEQWRAGCDGFLKEARKLAKIDSLPGIVRVRDTFMENQTAYIVMDFIEGETLKQRLKKTGPLRFDQCVELLRPLMESLGKMHNQGMIHRDISPDNIMVQPDGNVCLLDFGAAKDISFQQTAASQQVAKKGFSPPEQYREKGHIGPWTDVYALSATLYYCVTGRLLPDAMDRMYEDKSVFDMMPAGPFAETAACALRDGLKLRTEERIQTVGELLARLEGAGAAQLRPEPARPGAGRPQSGLADEGKSQPGQVSASTVPKEPSGKKMEITKVAAIAVAVVLGVFVVTVVGVMGAAFLSVGKHDDKAWVSETAGQPDVREEVSEAEAVAEPLSEPELSVKAVPEPKPQLTSPPVFADDEAKSPGILMKDDSGRLGEDNLYYGTVLGSNIGRDVISSVTFLDTLDQMPATVQDRTADAKDMAGLSWDVSWEQNGSVMAWIEKNASYDDMYDLYIGAEGGVKAQDCEELFAGYFCAASIDFNDCFDTSLSESMSGMFFECANLKGLDLGGFDTGRVTDMSAMFCMCASLKSIDLESFDTGAVTDMDIMFASCRSLTGLDVSGFDVGSLESWEEMFDGCAVTARQAGFAVAEEYILPESDSRYLVKDDLWGLSKEECRIARNEIFARHGRRFDDESLQAYFDSCSWYTGTIAPEDFDDSVLNVYEVANRDLIVRYEQEMMYR